MIQFQNKSLTVFQSALYQTTSAVVETEEAVILTDPNWLLEEVKAIRQFIDERLSDRTLYIIYTHSDFDHIIGAGAFPEATVIASEAFQNNGHKDELIKQCESFDQRYYITRDYEHNYPAVDSVITKDGQQVKIGEVTLTFYLSPGHTPDGLLTVVEPYGILLSGDYLSDVECPFIFSSYADYVETIKKASRLVKSFDIRYHVPGHGNATESKEEIKRRVDFSTYYLNDLANDSQALKDKCKKVYPFFEGMEDNHKNNVEMAKKQLY